MCMLDHRLQILLDEKRYKKVADLARARSVSVAAVIRDAIDTLPDSGRRRDAAIAGILAAEPISVPEDPSELRAELDDAHRAARYAIQAHTTLRLTMDGSRAFVAALKNPPAPNENLRALLREFGAEVES